MRRRGKYEAPLLSHPNLSLCLALRSADPAAVHIMFAMLLPFSIIFDISSDDLCRQLEREYELPIDLDTDIAMEPPSQEERKNALYCVCITQMARLPPHERWE